MTNSADPDQLASDLDLHCLQRQGISGSAGQGLMYQLFCFASSTVISQQTTAGQWLMYRLFSFAPSTVIRQQTNHRLCL